MKLFCSCQNPDCHNYNKEVEIDWDGLSSFRLAEILICPNCKVRRQLLDKNLDNRSKLETIATPVIGSMTPAERKALLKERSTKDFYKNIEERKREMDRNVIPR